MTKTPKSFTVNDDVARIMTEREDVNWSGLVNNFLEEYVASGQGTEAALAVRLEQLEQDLDQAKGKVRRLEAERDRVEEALSEKREDRREVFASFDELDGMDIESSNPAVQTHAEKLGMKPEVFVAKYEEWKGE